MSFSSRKIGIDKFAFQYFDSSQDGTARTKLGTVTPSDFTRLVQTYVNQQASNGEKDPLKEGYAPFCKHVFIPNDYDVIPAYIDLVPEVKRFIRTGYITRRPEELPVLSRWIALEDWEEIRKLVPSVVERAKYIDVILYSREQVLKEYEAMKDDGSEVDDSDWFIISLKFQLTDKETPMQPITSMRNALISEGGSGVAIDREKYLESVRFWENHVEVH